MKKFFVKKANSSEIVRANFYVIDERGGLSFWLRSSKEYFDNPVVHYAPGTYQQVIEEGHLPEEAKPFYV